MLKKFLYCSILILLFVSACAEHKVVLKENEYIELAEKKIADEDYKEARQAFDDLEANYPDSKFLAQARFKSARTHFDEEHYSQAATGYIRFLRFHPRNPLSAEAQYYLGLSYFNDRLSIDRDPDKTQKALEEFNLLIDNYSDSSFVTQAREKRDISLEELASHELYIGDFYHKMESFEAAIGRYQQLYLNFQHTKSAPAALFKIAESYRKLGKTAEAEELYNLFLSKYPDHEYAPKAKEFTN